jgi:hypothetical protein
LEYQLFRFFFGNLSYLTPYSDGTGIPQFKVLSIQIFYFISLIAIYYSLFISIKKDPNFIFSIWPTGLIATIPVYYTLFPPLVEHHNGLSSLYLLFGDYLAHQHNINWYYMDWGGWMIAIALYCWPLYTLLIYKIISLIVRNKKQIK